MAGLKPCALVKLSPSFLDDGTAFVCSAGGVVHAVVQHAIHAALERHPSGHLLRLPALLLDHLHW